MGFAGPVLTPIPREGAKPAWEVPPGSLFVMKDGVVWWGNLYCVGVAVFCGKKKKKKGNKKEEQKKNKGRKANRVMHSALVYIGRGLNDIYLV